MAGNRVGALYYEVILNPKGFADGAGLVMSQQRLLKKAAKDTLKPHQALQAELHQYLALAKEIQGTGGPLPADQQQALDIVLSKIDQIIVKQKELKKLQYDKETEKRVEQLGKERLEAEERLSKEAERRRSIEERFLAVARDRKKRLDEQARKEAEIRKLREDDARKAKREHEEQKSAEKKRVDQMVKNWQYLERVKKKSLELEEKAAKEKAENDHNRTVEQSLERLKNFKQYGFSVDGLTRAFADVKVQVNEVNGGLSKFAGNLAQAAGMTPAIQGLARVLGSMGMKWLLGIGAIVAAGKAIKSSMASAESFRVSLLNLQYRLGGNRKEAEMLANQMEDLAVKAGVSSDQMRGLANTLLTMGVATGEIKDIAQMVAILSEGDPTKMKGVAKAYTDAVAKGRLMGQEAIQFANAQVPVYSRIGEILGKNRQEVMKMVESGEITIDILDKALELQTEMLGGSERFAENMRSSIGQAQRFENAMERIKRILGEPWSDLWRNFIEYPLQGLELIAKALNEIKYLMGDMTIFDLLHFGMRAKKIEPPMTQEEFDKLPYEEKIAQQVDKKALGFLVKGIAGVNRERERALDLESKRQAALKRTLDQIAEEKKLEEDINLEFQEQVQHLNDQLLTEEQLRDVEYERLITSKKFNDQQIRELRARYYNLEAQKKINKQLEEDKRKSEQAGGMGAPRFEAGSVEEYTFFRERERSRRKEQQDEMWNKRASDERREVNKTLNKMLKQQEADARRDTVQGYRTFDGVTVNL